MNEDRIIGERFFRQLVFDALKECGELRRVRVFADERNHEGDCCGGSVGAVQCVGKPEGGRVELTQRESLRLIDEGFEKTCGDRVLVFGERDVGVEKLDPCLKFFGKRFDR